MQAGVGAALARIRRIPFPDGSIDLRGIISKQMAEINLDGRLRSGPPCDHGNGMVDP
jgi:hypothetical protein